MAAVMTDEQISDVVIDILSRQTGEAGFLGAEVASDQDFDDTPIIRVRARYERRPDVEPDLLIEAVRPIRTALHERGEHRFVFLTNDVLSERWMDEQIQEDVD